MQNLADRLLSTPKSEIRKLFEYAQKQEDVISLGIGQPDFQTFGAPLNRDPR